MPTPLTEEGLELPFSTPSSLDGDREISAGLLGDVLRSECTSSFLPAPSLFVSIQPYAAGPPVFGRLPKRDYSGLLSASATGERPVRQRRVKYPRCYFTFDICDCINTVFINSHLLDRPTVPSHPLLIDHSTKQNLASPAPPAARSLQ